MNRSRWVRLILVLLSGGVSVLWGCSLGWSLSRGPLDFQAIYYGSRTLLEHRNPYSVPEVEQTYRTASAVSQAASARQHQNMTLYVNTPGTLLFIAALALLPLAAGQILWMVLGVGSIFLAAYLIWDLAAIEAPTVSGLLVCFMLLNCQVVFGGGNTAGVVVGLCSVGTWCLLREKFIAAGILCMAVSLLIKPHDAGLVWLFFLLAGGINRKRAIQSALLTAALALIAVLWVSSIAPTWLHDWQSNLAAISGSGGINDPRPTALGASSANNVISLQAVFSVFSDNPLYYNLASYLFCGSLLVVWVATTLRSTSSRRHPWFAIAVVAPLTMLITYHRVHDAKLLLLTIPACAMLWALHGRLGWTALLITFAPVVVNADVPLAVFGHFVDKLHLNTSNLPGQIATTLIARPSQLSLVVMTVFYLWVYLRQREMEVPE